MEIKEFKRKPINQKPQKKSVAFKKKSKRSGRNAFGGWNMRELTENKSLIMLCAFVLLAVLTIVLGLLVFHIPAVTVCLVILIEALLAVCLHNVPLWVHGIVLVAEVALGIYVSLPVFMILAAICYLVAIFVLKFEAEKENIWSRA